MRRVNTFDVRPRSHRDRLVLIEVLDASAALWNELTYHRRQAFFDGDSVWDVDVDEFRELQTLARNDQYTLEWGERSRLEIPVGFDLKEKYGLGYYERLRLEARGDPRWDGEQGRLELVYDRDAESFKARQPVTDAVLRRDDSLAATPRDDGAVAALDIGANNLVTLTTTSGYQRLYHGRPQFHVFHQTTREIALHQERLACSEDSSRRIRMLYRERTDRRDHLQDALVRDLAEWLTEVGVTEVIAGDLSGVLTSSWSTRVNEKNHLFWSHGRFRRRLREVLEGEYGIAVEEVDESGSSSTCPACGGERVDRYGDLLTCRACGFEGHSDVAASENLLCDAVGSMARPAVSRENTTENGHRTVPCLEWDDHRWRRRDRSTKEGSANRSIHGDVEKLASGVSA